MSREQQRREGAADLTVVVVVGRECAPKSCCAQKESAGRKAGQADG